LRILPPYFYFRFSRNQVIFNDFLDIWHSISAREGGNTVCYNAIVRNTTVEDSVTYWFPWKHSMARRRPEFGVFDQTLPKTGSSARPNVPRRSIIFPPQNYHSQSIGSALQASPIASFGAFAQKHTPKCGLGFAGLAFGASKIHQAPLFPPDNVHLAVSDMRRSTPTTLSVHL